MKLKASATQFFNHRMLTVLMLGFASGLPLALSGATLQAWYTVAGISVIGIGWLSMVGQPYVYKFLWSPLLDRYIPPLLGRRRGWILITQLGLVLLILWMALLSPSTNPVLLGFLALGVAFFSASQDIAVDAYRTEVLPKEERGMGAAMFVGGYRTAMLISGGLAFIIASALGWRMTYIIMALLMAGMLVITWFAPEPKTPNDVPVSLKKAIIEPLRELLARPRIASLLFLIVIYKLGDAFALSMTTTFLLRGLDFSLIDIGIAYKLVGFIATIIGVFIGGALLTRLGLYRALILYGLLQAGSNFLFAVLAWVGKSYVLLVITIFTENLCGGLATAAFLAFLMSLCDTRYTATQFALLSALAAIGRVFVGVFAGYFVHAYGWAEFYLWTVVVALPGVLLVYLLRRSIKWL